METKENITTEELVVQPAQELEEVEIVEEEPIVENTSTTDIPQEYQEDIQVNPGTPIVIIHNDNSSNANNQSTVQQTVQQNTNQQTQQPLVQKSKWVAFFLCLFLGTIGAHQFYCGWFGKGITMLILSFTGVGLIISSLWALWNLVQILMGSFPVKGGLPI